VRRVCPMRRWVKTVSTRREDWCEDGQERGACFKVVIKNGPSIPFKKNKCQVDSALHGQENSQGVSDSQKLPKI